MEPTEENLRLHAATVVLVQMIERVTKGRQMGRLTLYQVDEIIKEHRRLSKEGGLDYPVMVQVPLVRQGRIEIFRADLEDKDLQVQIMNLTVKYPRATAEEIANGLNYGYPKRRLIHVNMDARQGFVKHAQG